MAAITQIKLNQPCTQLWDGMTPVLGGRFCTSCSKAVVDMTTMTNQQIIEHLSANSGVCGRIKEAQLSAVNHQLQVAAVPHHSYWKRWILALLFFTSFKATKAQAPVTKAPTEQAPLRIKIGEVVAAADRKPDMITLQGKVIDRNDQQPIPAVVIVAGKYHTLTDAQGNFCIKVPVGTKLLQVKSIGYETQEVKIGHKKQNNYNIKIKAQATLLGGLGAINQPQRLNPIYSFVLDSRVGRWLRS